jgi:hypothetical protein
MDKEDYLKKAYDLNNMDNYRKIKKYPTPSVTKQIREVIKTLEMEKRTEYRILP